eukprot:8511608-Alexandrium_andersonii.AAC.2
MSGNGLGTGACWRESASATSFDIPGMCLSCDSGIGLTASSRANSWAIRFNVTDGVVCCRKTASAPRLSELTDTGVARVNILLHTRRLINTARASQRVSWPY